MKILISSGSDKFQLIPLAAELDKNKKFKINVFTSAYPRDHEIKFFKFFNIFKFKVIERFIQRKENIEQLKVKDYRVSEILFKAANLIKKNSKFKNYLQNILKRV